MRPELIDHDQEVGASNLSGHPMVRDKGIAVMTGNEELLGFIAGAKRNTPAPDSTTTSVSSIRSTGSS